MSPRPAPPTSHQIRRLASGPPAVLLLLAVVAGCNSDILQPPPPPPPPPAATRIVVISGDAQSGPIDTDLPLPLTVRVVDQNGAPFPGKVTFEVIAGAGSLSGGSSQIYATASADGLASVSWRLGFESEAAQEVRATLNGAPATNPSSVTFHATAQSLATRIEIVSGDGQTGPADASLPLALTVRTTDPAGQPAKSLVVFEVREGAGSLSAGSPTRTVTSAEGIAAVSWRLGSSASPQEVRASIPNRATEGSSATFRATVLPGAPSAIRLLSPAAAAVPEGPSFTEDINALVVDRFGTPVPGVAVSWRITSAAGRFDADIATTDAAGVVSNRWTITPRTGPLLGVYSMEISLGVDAVAKVERTAGSGIFVASSAVAGEAHTCALDPAQEAYCWGGNSFGQLGDGSNFSRNLASTAAGGHRFVALVAGGLHTCGIATTGESYCWGSNSYGQLGDGSRTDRAEPVLVSAGLQFVALAAGAAHTCGVVADGTAYCWGLNRSAQLGDPTFTADRRPTPGRVPTALRFVSLAAGGEDTCAATSDGAGYCWGINDARQADPRQVNGTVPSPALIEGSYTALAAGGLSTCGRRATGAVACWGAAVAQPVLISIPPIATVTAGNLTTCGLTGPGELFCWAVVVQSVDCGYYGSCDSYNGFSAPARVEALLPSSSVTIGSSHFCAIARADQWLYCWGQNNVGQLGTGRIPSDNTPPAPVRLPGRP